MPKVIIEIDALPVYQQEFDSLNICELIGYLNGLLEVVPRCAMASAAVITTGHRSITLDEPGHLRIASIDEDRSVVFTDVVTHGGNVSTACIRIPAEMMEKIIRDYQLDDRKAKPRSNAIGTVRCFRSGNRWFCIIDQNQYDRSEVPTGMMYEIGSDGKTERGLGRGIGRTIERYSLAIFDSMAQHNDTEDRECSVEEFRSTWKNNAEMIRYLDELIARVAGADMSGDYTAL